MNITKLIEATKQWGIDKGITGPNGKGTIERQFAKFIEELHEFLTAEKRPHDWPADKEWTEDDIRKATIDALGDMQVVCIQACVLLQCIERPIRREPYPTQDITSAASEAVHRLKWAPEQSFRFVRGMADISGFDPDECLQAAYDVISKRTGKMEAGQFVKDAEVAK